MLCLSSTLCLPACTAHSIGDFKARGPAMLRSIMGLAKPVRWGVLNCAELCLLASYLEQSSPLTHIHTHVFLNALVFGVAVG